jgi:hypothetical protein
MSAIALTAAQNWTLPMARAGAQEATSALELLTLPIGRWLQLAGDDAARHAAFKLPPAAPMLPPVRAYRCGGSRS